MFKSTKFWLIVSLCVNMIFIGVFAGGVLHERHDVPKRGGPPPNEIAAIFRAMPKETREGFVGEFRDHQPPHRHADLGELADRIAAEPFDENALRQYFDEARRSNDQRVVDAQNALILSLSQMDADERQAMAERLRNMPKRKDGKRKGGH